MILKGHKTPDERLNRIISDISRYMNYLGMISLGMAGGQYEIKFLPYSKSYDEHPFWLINKLEYIKNMLNKGLPEIKKK